MLNLFTTSSLFSLALIIKFYNEIFGAIELNVYLQKGHFLFYFEYVFIHFLQYVCPHGNKINGWCSGGKNNSKQIGHLLDIT